MGPAIWDGRFSAMNERQMEIIVSRGIESVLGVGHRLVAQQLGLDRNRLDLLVLRPDGGLMVVELKKGQLTRNSVEQVSKHADVLSTDTASPVAAMVIAQEALPPTADYAERRGVCLKTISESQLHETAKQIGLSKADLLGYRRKAGVLFGGGTGLRTAVAQRHGFTGGMLSSRRNRLRQGKLVAPSSEGVIAGDFRRRGGGGTFLVSYRGSGRDRAAGRHRRWPSGLAYRSTATLVLYANLELKAMWRRRIAYH